MKRIISIIIAIMLILCMIPAISFAASSGATVSPQKLSFNGENVTCEVYSINGNNYFKLRDIASLLSGTASQFSVGWNAEASLIEIATGSSYAPVGGELNIRGDLSGSAQSTDQALMINGKAVSGLSVYNIGGNNFFKLRDLATALDFKVDYDSATNSVLVADKESDIVFPEKPTPAEEPKQHTPQKTETPNSAEYDYVANKNTKKFHLPECSSVSDMKESNKWFFHGDRQTLIDQGYEPCKRCHP